MCMNGLFPCWLIHHLQRELTAQTRSLRNHMKQQQPAVSRPVRGGFVHDGSLIVIPIHALKSSDMKVRLVLYFQVHKKTLGRMKTKWLVRYQLLHSGRLHVLQDASLIGPSSRCASAPFHHIEPNVNKINTITSFGVSDVWRWCYSVNSTTSKVFKVISTQEKTRKDVERYYKWLNVFYSFWVSDCMLKD